MKEIMKEHGGLLVTVAVTICILTIIFSAVTDSDGNRGIVKIIAAHMNTDGTDYNAMQTMVRIRQKSQKMHR